MSASPWIASPLTWIVISVIASTAATAFSIAWTRSLRRVRELEQYLVQREGAPAEAEVREELFRQLEDVSAQVNRLADGQDFLARLVSDRRLDAARPKPEPPQLSTPH